VLQSNFGAEHAKGPVALSFVSKQGGRDFHGSVFGQLRDWHLNSNEWYSNKVEAERVKNLSSTPASPERPAARAGHELQPRRDRVFFSSASSTSASAWTRAGRARGCRPRPCGTATSARRPRSAFGSWVNTVPNGFPGGSCRRRRGTRVARSSSASSATER